MRRTIEKLDRELKQKENEFRQQLDRLKKQCGQLSSLSDRKSGLGIHSSRKKSKPSRGKPAGDGSRPLPASDIWEALEFQAEHTQTAVAALADALQSSLEVGDARDRKWDALGSNHVNMIFKSMEWRVDQLAAAYEDVTHLMKMFLFFKEKLDRTISLLEKDQPPAQEVLEELSDSIEEWRYAGFENRYRGSTEDVSSQLKRYVSFFEGKDDVVDLGCGRGEFIEMLGKEGIHARGVDLNGQMIEICREKGLDCCRDSITNFLELQPDESLGGIFSSQVIEHLSPAELKKTIELSFVKLKPSAAIILETVNPTSVFALVQVYFLDLTHEKPVHPQALRFLLESAGFIDVEIVFSSSLGEDRLEELPSSDEEMAILNRNFDKLNKLLYSPSNYAAIGRKP